MLDEYISWRDHKRRILTGEIIQVLTGGPLKLSTLPIFTRI